MKYPHPWDVCLLLLHKRLAIVLVIVFLQTAVAAGAESPNNSAAIDTVRIGVRAQSGVESAIKKWSSTAETLNQAIPGYVFELAPRADFDEMAIVVANGAIDFVLTNPTAYAELEHKFQISRMVTLKNGRTDGGATSFAGVVFTRSDRTDIEMLKDVRGHSVMGVHRQAFGGWQMALREWRALGIDPFTDCTEVLFAADGTNEPVVWAVLNCDVDVGTVRTGIIEGLVGRGELAAKDIKILNRMECGLQYSHSTRHYPEWPFAKLSETPEELARLVAVVLLSMTADDPAPVAGGYTGWTTPLNYNPVHDIMLELRVGPYENYGHVTLEQALHQYWAKVLSVAAAVAALFFFTIYVISLNRRLRGVQDDLRQKGDNLEQLVDLRTAELGESKKRYHAIVEDMPVLVCRFLPGGEITYVNQAYCEFFAQTPEELVGQTFQSLIPAEDQDSVTSNLSKLTAASPIQIHEHKVLAPNGEIRWQRWINRALFDAAEKIVTYQSIGEDITESRQAMQELRQNEQMLRVILNASNDVAMLLKPDGTIVAINEKAAKGLGFPVEELLGKVVFDLQNSDLFAKRREVFRNFVADKTPYRVEDENRGRCFDNKLLPVFDDSGNLRFGVLFARDITAQKQAAKELEMLMSAINQVSETIVITDTKGAIQYTNPAFAKISGYTCEEALGQNPSVLKSGEQGDAFYNELWETLHRGDVWAGRFVNKRKDGTRYTEEATISPVRDASGQTVNYVAVKRDISLELQLENQLRQGQKMEAVGLLAGGVAHDFNNMLGVIIGHSELALDEAALSQVVADHLEQIHKAAGRSTDLTRQLLAFARKQTIEPRVIDLNSTVADMLEMLQRLIGEDIDLAWRPGEKVWPVEMDPSQIDQILVNLCINARDAIDDTGKVTIETNTAVFDAAYCAEHPGFVPGEFVLLAVSDDGSGMDKDTKNHIFEPFFTTKGSGTGLGLATTYGIVKQNEGFINVYSEPGEGSTFKIYLPGRIGQAASEWTADKTDIQNGPVPEGQETILLVEDEEGILELTTRLLERQGYTVLAASSPEEAISRAEQHEGDIQLLMTDVVMPGMNGRDLAERLVSICPDLKCLFMSGYTADVITHRGILETGVHFLHKPFSILDLATRVRSVLDSD
ncbi:MAG: PAS domain S-box protein [Gemmatimonadales bacterium]|nr:PAS domain S-box protein [Gemmatimonadales bacterium]